MPLGRATKHFLVNETRVQYWHGVLAGCPQSSICFDFASLGQIPPTRLNHEWAKCLQLPQRLLREESQCCLQYA